MNRHPLLQLRHLPLLSFILLILALPAGAALSQGPTPPPAPPDWRASWGLAEGFTLDIDAEGFAFPSAIAFVPNPGTGPKDPLYYLTELRGAIKVVTNDRTVYTFASNPYSFVPGKELPEGYGQGGTAGLCLDQAHGYVFVTFLYQDDFGQLRNGMVRFQTQPGTMGIAPSSQRAFTEMFSGDVAGLAHFIGNCRVKDDVLYVGSGESWQSYKAKDIHSVLGKVLRMSLDGEPLPDNPFYEDDDPHKAQNYVWVAGVRNPWGLSFAGDRLFAADNGARIDRFIELKRGENYLWDGSDSSIATNATYVWTPAIGPTQMEYLPPDAAVFPEQYHDRFFIGAASGNGTSAGIFQLNYSLSENKLLEPPHYFLRWVAPEDQMVVAVGFGPDGLYFAPLYPGPDGTSPIIKIRYDPAHSHTIGPDQVADPAILFSDRGCIGCHQLDSGGGYGGSAGPPLTRATLAQQLEIRLSSQAYLESLAKIDELSSEPQASYRAAREEVRKAQGLERVRTWIKYRIIEPRFDNTTSMMPTIGMSEADAKAIAAFLSSGGPAASDTSLLGRANRLLRSRLVVGGLAFALGFVAAVLFSIVIGRARRRRS